MLSAMLIACGSVPRTMGPYKEAESRSTASRNNNSTPQTQPQTQPKPQAQTQQNNYDVREETFSMISISDATKLKAYSIVIGSFSVEENAKKLKKNLYPDYDPIIVINEKGMFRVIAASFGTYDAAKEAMVKFQGSFHDAWILTQKK